MKRILTLDQLKSPGDHEVEDLVEGFADFMERMPEDGPDSMGRQFAIHSFMIQFRDRELDPVAALLYRQPLYTLTLEEIDEVLDDVRAQIMGIVDDPASRWEGGPAGVKVRVGNCFGERGRIFGNFENPQPNWDDFGEFARQKGLASLAEQKPSHQCALVELIKAGALDRNWMGGDALDCLWLGSSGLTEEADAKCTAIVKAGCAKKRHAKNRPHVRGVNTCALR